MESYKIPCFKETPPYINFIDVPITEVKPTHFTLLSTGLILMILMSFSSPDLSCYELLFSHNFPAGCACGISLWAGHSKSSLVAPALSNNRRILHCPPRSHRRGVVVPLGHPLPSSRAEGQGHLPSDRRSGACPSPSREVPPLLGVTSPTCPGSPSPPLAMQSLCPVVTQSLCSPKTADPRLGRQPRAWLPGPGAPATLPRSTTEREAPDYHTHQGHHFWKHHTSQIFMLLCDSLVVIF